MALKGWVPALGPLQQLQRELDGLFESVFGPTLARRGRLPAGYVYPPLNVRETDGEYVVECELPGLNLEDVEVTVTGDHVTVSGTRAPTPSEEGVTLHRRERDTGRFSRGLTLPGAVDSAGAKATLRHGLLTVHVPKAERARPKRIAVHPETEEPAPKEE